MNILLFYNGYVPVLKYGGIERVIYSLAQSLEVLGHNVTLLVTGSGKKSSINTLIYNPKISLNEQIPLNTDIVHFHSEIDKNISFPYVYTMHGNKKDQTRLDKNTVFVSKNHAQRFASDSYVYNGLNWDDCADVDLNSKRKYYHYLANAAWRIKNVKGAIKIAKRSGASIKILGGKRFNFRMGLRLTFTPKARFYGMVDDFEKANILNGSRGLIFPVLWHEPFGLSIIESLYYGTPVFATPYGSLKELITQDVGVLSNNMDELVDGVKNNNFNARICHEYVNDKFNSIVMAENYLLKYLQVLNGHFLHEKKPFLVEIQNEKFLKFS